MKYLLFLLLCIILFHPDILMADDSLMVLDSLPHPDTLTAGQTLDSIAVTHTIYPMSEERKTKLAAYSQFRNIWRFTDFFISIGILLLILFTGISAKIQKLTAGIKMKFFAVAAFLVLFFILEYILNLPFQIYSNFLVESEFGFVNQTFGSWFSESVLSLFISIVFGIVAVWFIYWLINRTRHWWLYFAAGSIPFIVFVMIVFPIFIAPLYNDFVEVENNEVKTEILNLAESAGIHDADIFQVNASKQSSKINAYVTGVLNSKRIVLYDNLINNFTTNEIKFVMGHEMGHYILNHIWKSLFATILFIAFALWLTNLTFQRFIDKYKNRLKFEKAGEIASLPLLLIYISIISFLFNPVTNSISRYYEHQSDIFAMEITDVSGDEAATAFDKLSAYNLSDPDPHPIIEFWFYSHPSLKSRMEFVKEYRLSKS